MTLAAARHGLWCLRGSIRLGSAGTVVAVGRCGGLRLAAARRGAGLVAGCLVGVVLWVSPVARADSPTTLTVVGTSDLQDSGMVTKLITPMFEKQFPQFTLRYVSVGSGVAINDAESGVASVLIVHAASLENQFVAQGFSTERFGRAVFYGDYVLLGPASDPAGVLSGAPHDMVGAFAKIAAAGAAGRADFVSRGGTPGTTVQEHAIWALDAGTPGLSLCAVSAANGGGTAPSNGGDSAGSTPCPTSSQNPSWYHTTGLTQGPNIEAANTCNFTNAANNGRNDCYVFTDRGTFQCLEDPTCSAGSAAPANLKIVTRDNSPTAQGGQTLLINSFHAYAINPQRFAGNPNVQINSTAAMDFLNFLTAPSFQAQLKTFLAGTHDPPFIADASPAITASRLPKKVTGGRKLTVKGTIANLVPGTPALASKTVTVSEVGSGLAAGIPIASGKTDATGNYRITFSPANTGSYQVSTGEISQIENRTLNPVFGDLLQPAATIPSKIAVHGALAGVSFMALPGRVLVTGSVLPGSGHGKGSVALLARHGRNGKFQTIVSTRLASGDHAFALSATRQAGSWFLEVRFQDLGRVLAVTSRARKLAVPPRQPAGVTARSQKVKNGRVTITGRVAPTPSSGMTVEVLALDAGALPGTTPGGGRAAATAAFHQVGKVRLKAGAARFTVHGKLRRGQHWILELKYMAGGSAGTGYAGLRSIRVL
ncbi:MAG: substrate-binding domain-containing protein [Solirubrobacteraceae bacterium]